MAVKFIIYTSLIVLSCLFINSYGISTDKKCLEIELAKYYLMILFVFLAAFVEEIIKMLANYIDG